MTKYGNNSLSGIWVSGMHLCLYKYNECVFVCAHSCVRGCAHTHTHTQHDNAFMQYTHTHTLARVYARMHVYHELRISQETTVEVIVSLCKLSLRCALAVIVVHIHSFVPKQTFNMA